MLHMPPLGFGTYPLRGAAYADAVCAALALGYRHLDTARRYDNEDAVGQGLRASGVPRDQVFLTSKIWFDRLAPGVLQDEARRAVDAMGVDRLDLLLIHWPDPHTPLDQTMAALAEVKRLGLADRIGVSNFPSAMLDQAAALCPEPLSAVQVEHHPFLPQTAIVAAARRLGLQTVAYSPLAQGLIQAEPVLEAIAKAHDRTIAQVALRWLTQRGWAAIPKTSNPQRALANLRSLDFDLGDEDLAAIDALGAKPQRTVDPAWAPQWD